MPPRLAGGPKKRPAAEAGKIVHGVLMDVHGLGVLFEGVSGIGKSALALELLRRGHRLVADDAVEVWRVADGVLAGRSPALLKHQLEVRGFGIVNVRKLLGARAVRDQKRIELVIQLERTRKEADRLGARRGKRRISGVAVDKVHLHAGARRLRDNLPNVVETACLDQELRLLGLSGEGDFEKRQHRAMRKTAEGRK